MARDVSRGTDQLYKFFYEDNADTAREADNQVRDNQIIVDRNAHQTTAEIQAQSNNPGFVNLKGDAMYLGNDRE